MGRIKGSSPEAPRVGSGVRTTSAGTLGGVEVGLFHLETGEGARAEVLAYGATLVSLVMPGPRGELRRVVLGHDTLEACVRDRTFMGATVGRFSNRIGNARFNLDGRAVVLPANDGPHHLHGGPGGFHTRVFAGEPFETGDAVGVKLYRVSPAGEEGYPGRLETTVTYALSPGVLTIEYQVVTDAPTVVSLSPHPYFNLSDAGAAPAVDHVLQIDAAEVLVIDPAGIPTGARASVADTPLDFRTPRALREGLGALLRDRGGYDHPFVLNGPEAEGPLRRVATLAEPTTGLRMDLETTAPCLQLYSGQHLPAGPRSGPFHGLCLEPQSYPDAPNQPSFPSARLDAGAVFRRTTVLRFSA